MIRNVSAGVMTRPVEPVDPGPGRGLVIQAGPGAGSFLPFHEPVTLLGRSGGCDVRLDAQSVRPLHCLLTPGVDGVALRTLGRDGVQHNGRPASTGLLRDGDLLAIGPFRLRVRWPANALPEVAGCGQADDDMVIGS